MEHKIELALIVAHKSLPYRLYVVGEELKEEALTRSAEVTTYGRVEGLLTESQFIFFGVSTIEGAARMIPCAWDGDKLLGYLDESVAKMVHHDPDLKTPSAWGLLDDFKSRKEHPFSTLNWIR